MHWRKNYVSKLRSIPEALSLIRSGDRIITQFGVAIPCALLEGLYDIREKVENVELNLVLPSVTLKSSHLNATVISTSVLAFSILVNERQSRLDREWRSFPSI